MSKEDLIAQSLKFSIYSKNEEDRNEQISALSDELSTRINEKWPNDPMSRGDIAETLKNLVIKNGLPRFTFNLDATMNGRFPNCSDISFESIQSIRHHQSPYQVLHNEVSNFGQTFCRSIGGHWSGVGDLINPIKSHLQEKEIISTLLKRPLKHQDIPIPNREFSLGSTGYVYLDEVAAYLYAHEPTLVEPCTDEWRIEKVNNVPYIIHEKLQATFVADLTFMVTKSFVVRKWAKVFSLGMNCVWDQTKKKIGDNEWYKNYSNYRSHER